MKRIKQFILGSVVSGIISALLFVAPVAFAAPVSLFADGFESNSFANWDAVPGSNFAVSGGTCRTGPDHNVVAIKITGASAPHGQVMKKTFSTVGYENIAVSFCFKWDVLENGDAAVVEYTTNGTSWTVVKTIDNSTVRHMMYAADNTEIATSNGVGEIPTPLPMTQSELMTHVIMLPADAANSAGFAIRVREQMTDGNDFVWIDDLAVTGTAIVDPSPVPVNFIPNSSLESTATDPSLPQSWFKGGWGTNTRSLTYPVAGQDGVKAAKIDITAYTTGDAKWYFAEVPVTVGHTYIFSDWYHSTANTYLAVRLKMSDNSFSYIDLAQLGPSPTWQNVTREFVIPPNVVSLTAFHLLKQVGSLTVDNFSLTNSSAIDPFDTGLVSLTFDDGWASIYENAVPILDAADLKSTQFIISGFMNVSGRVSTADVLALQASGHEIGAHTKTHPDLSGLTPTDLQTEVGGSRRDLILLGASPVRTIAYPEGDYNTTVENTALSSGYEGARSVVRGYNGKNTARYALKVQMVNATTTPAEIQGWIDQALEDKTWLIIAFHQVDHSGEPFSTTPESFQAVVDYLLLTGAPVVTVSEGLALMDAGATIPLDTTAPVITLSGAASVNITTGGSFTDAGATAFDNVDGSLTSSILVSGDAVNTTIPGTYQVRYNVSDLVGNPAVEAVRTVVVADASSNLILNPSLESTATDPSLPQSWFKGGWGTNTRTLSYPVAGQDGVKAAKIDITAYTTGDAKWYFANVNVTPGQTYAFSDWYQSTIPSYVAAQFKMIDNSFKYLDLAAVPASASWQNVQANFVVPASVASVAIFHVIKQVGSLTVDNYSLTTQSTPPPSNNSILNPSVETASATIPTLPQGWRQGRWGTHTTTFTYPTAGLEATKSVKIDVSAYTSGDAKWYFDDVAVTPGSTYTYSDKYVATTTTEVTARFLLASGAYQYAYLGTLSAQASATTASFNVVAPSTAVSMTVFHIIASVGSLTTDGYSLTH